MNNYRGLLLGVMWFILPVLCIAQAPLPLPEGNKGIATEYPGDVGISTDPAVVFFENFENVSESSLSETNSAFDAVYGPNIITQVADNVNSGINAVETTHTSSVSFGGVKNLGSGYETLHLRYYMKCHDNFPGMHHTGGGIYAAQGLSYTQIGNITGVHPDGTNNFHAYLDNLSPLFSWSPEGNDISPGWLHVYCYNMDQGGSWGDHFFPDGMILPGASGADFGNDFVSRDNVLPELGRWYCFEIMLQANTPGQADGRIAFWVDGQLAADFPGLNLRSEISLKPNHIAISTYSSELHSNKTIWYDDVVAATSYIGPIYNVTSIESAEQTSLLMENRKAMAVFHDNRPCRTQSVSYVER